MYYLCDPGDNVIQSCDYSWFMDSAVYFREYLMLHPKFPDGNYRILTEDKMDFSRDDVVGCIDIVDGYVMPAHRYVYDS